MAYSLKNFPRSPRGEAELPEPGYKDEERRREGEPGLTSKDGCPKPHSEIPVAAESAKTLRRGGCGEGTDLGRARDLVFLCLRFLIYKTGLKSPNMQNWREDYRGESSRGPLQAFSR